MTLKVRVNQMNVLRALVRRNMSQNMLAARTGMSTGYLSQLLTGVRYASPKARRRLLEALEPMSFDELFIIVEGGNGL